MLSGIGSFGQCNPKSIPETERERQWKGYACYHCPTSIGKLYFKNHQQGILAPP